MGSHADRQRHSSINMTQQAGHELHRLTWGLHLLNFSGQRGANSNHDCNCSCWKHVSKLHLRTKASDLCCQCHTCASGRTIITSDLGKSVPGMTSPYRSYYGTEESPTTCTVTGDVSAVAENGQAGRTGRNFVGRDSFVNGQQALGHLLTCIHGCRT